MSSQKILSTASQDIVLIKGPSDIKYWSQRFSVAPFTLFHVMRTVGNCITDIGEFLHKNNLMDPEGTENLKKDSTIL
jgi:hypothetical protein